jgi:hypothetical protein
MAAHVWLGLLHACSRVTRVISSSAVCSASWFGPREANVVCAYGAASPVEPSVVRVSGQCASTLQLSSAGSFGVGALTGRSSGTRRHRALNRRASSGIILLSRVVLGAPLS